jgi:hypothetical protein
VTKPLYIFDLDGTLALIEHRRHHVECERDKQDWKAFYAACVDDQPNSPVIKTLRALASAGADIWVFSGRSDEVEKETLDWLAKHVILRAQGELVLEMRHEGDYTPDDQLKLRWLNDMLPSDRERLVAVFEDRDRMVKMWRASGVPCFQVAPGDF